LPDGRASIADSGRSRAGNLPAELSSFIGRDAQLLEVRRRLAVTHTVTLTGPGGIGKSCLALRSAGELGRHFSDGAWLVKVAALESPELLGTALANSLEVYERSDVGIDDALLDHLRRLRLLLILDNCDTLLDACRELVGSIVSRCQGVRVLCTSRQRLGVPGEAVVAVAPLRVPAAAEPVSLAEVADAEALRLLVDRARAVAPSFALTEENCAAAADICRRLDGLPLAIELAAVRLASMTPDDLLERLDDRFRLLTAERGQELPRHAALQTTVEWSHELLGEEERILWRRLSVFAGGFSLDTAEAVCSGDGLEREQILELIGDLVDRSILTMAPGGRSGRYRFLETMRLFGAERLREAGEEPELRRRHALWYAEFASPGERPWWTRGAQAEVLDLLDAEWANVEAALDFLARSEADAQIGLRMAADLWLYWIVRGRYRLGRSHLEAFLARVETPSTTRVMALWASGFLAQTSGDHDVALARFEEAQDISAQIGADRERGYALIGLGLVRLRLGESKLAHELFAAARDAMLRVEDSTGRALALWCLATAFVGAGRLTDAREPAGEGLGISERAADAFGRGNLSALLGILEWLLDDAEAGEARLKGALPTLEHIGHRWGMVNAVEGLAWVAASTGRLDRAALLLGAGASLLQELGIRLAPYWLSYHEDCEAAARAGLGEARYRAQWEKGFALPHGARVAAALEQSFSDGPPPAPLADEDEFELTGRELEVARLVAEGLSNPAIASTLFVSRATVKTHVSHILRKLALDSRVQLATWVSAHDPGSAAPTGG
jgi:predicted ATPase/DNA-binding CsgD family transcriptional regulator